MLSKILKVAGADLKNQIKYSFIEQKGTEMKDGKKEKKTWKLHEDIKTEGSFK